jgi:RNA polymerase sigma-70 factor (ECF subfamily)
VNEANPSPGPESEINEDKQAVWQAINSLREIYRTVIILHHFQGMTFQEISEILQKPLGTISARWKRALSRLEKKLAPYYYPDK